MSNIFNCGQTKPEKLVSFSYECPKQWDILELTSKQSVQFCQVCQENVYYCINKEEAEQHANQGHCIVVEANLSETKRQTRGRVAVTKSTTNHQNPQHTKITS